MKKTVKCPICNRRLFDADTDSRGLVEIKCTQCKNIIKVQLDKLAGSENK